MKNILRTARLLFLSAAVVLVAQVRSAAQPFTEPTSAAYKAAVKEYVDAFQTGDLTKFKATLPALEQAHPGHPNTLFFQAFYQEMSGEDVVGAMKGYSDVIRLKPDFTEAYQHRAGLFSAKGMYDRAVADMDKAIEHAGADVYAAMYGDRGDFKTRAGDDAGAFADFKKAAETEPANPKWYRGVANMGIGMKNPAAAETVFNTALAGAQSGNGGISAAYADLLMRQQKFAEADAQSKLALAAPGFTPSAKDLNTAGIIAMKLRDYPRANGLLERGMTLDPSDVSIVLNRASVAMEQKAWEDVYTYAQKAIGVDANSAMANMMMAVSISRTGRGDALAAEYEAKAKKLDAEGK